MSLAQEPIFIWMSQYAYEPTMVYLGTIGMMILSGFGLPLPEEITIISVGILSYMGANPDIFPPPYAGAPVVNGYEAALITTFAVLFADLVVFSLGRVFGRKLVELPRFKKIFSGNIMSQVDKFVHKYGIFAAFIFRFTPGLRFPAHVMLGMSKFPAYQFGIVDGFAALISVPTQILLVYFYGEPILSALQKFKIYILITLALLGFLWGIRKLMAKYSKSGSKL